MRKVLATLNGHGGIQCHEKDCLYIKSCANHASAGDHRSEGGFSPQIQIVGENNEVQCATVDVNPLYEQYETLPVNHEELDRGEVYRDKDEVIRPWKPDYYYEYQSPFIDDDDEYHRDDWRVRYYD